MLRNFKNNCNQNVTGIKMQLKDGWEWELYYYLVIILISYFTEIWVLFCYFQVALNNIYKWILLKLNWYKF